MVKKLDTGKRTLEGSKVFPYAAWALVIGFSVFVYQIVADFNAVAVDLQVRNDALESTLTSVVSDRQTTEVEESAE